MPPISEHDQHLEEHTPEQIRDRLDAGPAQAYLRDSVFGAVDGTVTSFAVVSGVAGAGLSTGVVIILGLANLLGDDFSMAAGMDTDYKILRRLGVLIPWTRHPIDATS